MATDWPHEPLGQLVKNFDARRVPVSNRERAKRPGPYPYYGATGVMDHIDDFLFEGLHLLVGEDGSVETPEGKPFLQLVSGKFWVNNHAHVLKAATDDDTRFLYYALSTIAIRPYMSGSVQAKLSQSNLNRIPVPWPQADRVRRRIVQVLGALDDKIALNRRLMDTLEAMAMTLFNSWFVDRGIVHHNVDRVSSAQSETSDELLPSSLANTNNTSIPNGWHMGRFSDLVEHRRDQLNPLSTPENRFDLFSIPAFDLGQTPQKEFGESIKSLKSRVPAGAILLSKLNPEIERVWLVDVRPNEHAICSTEFLVLTPKPPFTRSYIYCLARSPLFRQQIQSLVTGTSKSHQRAQVDSILNLPALVPPASAVNAFDHHVERTLARVLECRRESQTLGALRDALIPKLMSGQLRVQDGEGFVAMKI